MSQENPVQLTDRQDGEEGPSAITPVSSGTPTIPRREGQTPAGADTPTLIKRESAMSGTGEAEQLEDNVFDVQLSEVNILFC